ncbi:MAG: hypothetical protein U5L11_15255 [Arhodomonas sp.]|nr:hypothetical protein [Arhodomonas sp.]
MNAWPGSAFQPGGRLRIPLPAAGRRPWPRRRRPAGACHRGSQCLVLALQGGEPAAARLAWSARALDERVQAEPEASRSAASSVARRRRTRLQARRSPLELLPRGIHPDEAHLRLH